MTTKFVFQVALGAMAIPFLCAQAAAPKVYDRDVYVALYQIRVELAKNAEKRQEAVIAYSGARVERNRRLYDKNALSAEELQESVARNQVDVTTLTEYQLKTSEAEALLKLTKFRRENGQEMPIFPYGSDVYNSNFPK